MTRDPDPEMVARIRRDVENGDVLLSLRDAGLLPWVVAMNKGPMTPQTLKSRCYANGQNSARLDYVRSKSGRLRTTASALRRFEGLDV